MDVRFVYIDSGKNISTPYIAGTLYFVEDEKTLYRAKSTTELIPFSGEIEAADWDSILNKPTIPSIDGLVNADDVTTIVNAMFSYDADSQTLSITTL